MFPYKNPDLPIEQRLDDLIGRMTLEELIMQIDQYNSNEFGVFTDGKDSPDYYDFEKLPELFPHPVIVKIIINANRTVEKPFFFLYTFIIYTICFIFLMVFKAPVLSQPVSSVPSKAI